MVDSQTRPIGGLWSMPCVPAGVPELSRLFPESSPTCRWPVRAVSMRATMVW